MGRGGNDRQVRVISRTEMERVITASPSEGPGMEDSSLGGAGAGAGTGIGTSREEQEQEHEKGLNFDAAIGAYSSEERRCFR